MIESIHEALTLLGRGSPPMQPEYGSRRGLDIEVRQQVLVDERTDLGGILLVHRPVRVQVLEHALGGCFHHFGRSRLILTLGGSGRCLRIGRAYAGQHDGAQHDSGDTPRENAHFLDSSFFDSSADFFGSSAELCSAGLLAKLANSLLTRFSSTIAD